MELSVSLTPGRFTALELAASTHWIGSWAGHLAGRTVVEKRQVTAAIRTPDGDKAGIISLV